MKEKLITIEIDKLTNSIENRITGDRFDTQVEGFKNREAFKKGKSSTGKSI